ncbi:MAG: transposase, partial [Nitriliruptoraceae bacterium]
TANFDRWAKRVDFIFGMDCNDTMRRHAEALPEAAWSRLERPAAYQPATDQRREREPDHKAAIVYERGYLNLELNFEDVAEFDYRPGKCDRDYRVVVLRKNITRSRGEHQLFDEIRYFFYITTRTDLTAAEVVYCANERCDQENINEQLKNGVEALRVPLYDLVSNWAYMVIATLAWNLKSWFSMMMHRKTDRLTYINMEFRRFIHAIVLIPARIIRRARTITVRIIGWQPTLDRMFSAWRTIERTGFT